MRFLLVCLLSTTAAFAADSQGGGSNPFGTTALDDTTTLSFFTKPEDDTLYFRLSWKENEGSSSTVSSGSGVPAKKEFAYYWDDSKKIFWFADGRFLQKFDMSRAKGSSTTSRISNIADYKGDNDFPSDFIASVDTLINKK